MQVTYDPGTQAKGAAPTQDIAILMIDGKESLWIDAVALRLLLGSSTPFHSGQSDPTSYLWYQRNRTLQTESHHGSYEEADEEAKGSGGVIILSHGGAQDIRKYDLTCNSKWRRMEY